MKKKAIIFICLVSNLISNISAQLIEEIPEMLFTFPQGTQPQEFERKPGTGKDDYCVPTSPRFLSDGRLVIFDPAMNVDKVYSHDFKFLENLPYEPVKIGSDQLMLDFTLFIKETAKYILFYDGNTGMVFFDKSRRYLGRSTFRNTVSAIGPNLSAIGDTTFWWTNDGRIYCNPFPDQFDFTKNTAKVLNRESINAQGKTTGSALEGYDIDNVGILRINGKPFLDNSKAIILYYSTLNPNYSEDKQHVYPFRGGEYFIGNDAEKNTIWVGPGRVRIVSTTGFSKTVIKTKRPSEITWGVPAIHPLSGDIYLIGYKFLTAALYRIKKTW